jgi:hypothetical protein
MYERESKVLVLFFLWATLDHRTAIFAAEKAINEYKKNLRQNVQIDGDVQLVQIGHKIWEKVGKKPLAGSSPLGAELQIEWPQNLSLLPWREFKKIAPDHEVLAVIWHQILKIPIAHIAQGLSVSEGTIRFRLNSGLHRLGLLMTSLEFHAGVLKV